jgi:hypothetical protein
MVSLNLGPLIEPELEIDGLEGNELVDAIVDWFHSNFEDPAQNTPYEGAEGGYQFIWGGPYDAREEITGYFGDLPEAVLEAVFEKLDEGMDWAPNDNRIFDEDPPDDPYENMQRALDRVEEALRHVQPFNSGIGGNHPPEEIGAPPYTDELNCELVDAIRILREPEEVLSKDHDKALQAATTFKSVGEKITDFLLGQTTQLADAFSSELGKRMAQGVAALIAWEMLRDRLTSAYEAAMQWLSTLPPIPRLPF